MESNQIVAGKNRNQTLHFLKGARRELAGAQAALSFARAARAQARLLVLLAEHHLVSLQIAEMQG